MAMAGGCERRERPQAAVRGHLVISGDTAGWITPCGCTSNQSGGLPRRASYVEELRKTGVVVCADAGGAVDFGELSRAAGTSEYQRIKFEAILAGEMKMGLAAHNLGASELAMGPAYLREVMGRTRAPLVSANVRDADGKGIGSPVVVVELAGRKMAIIGVVSQRYASETVRIDDPRQAVLSAIAQVKGQYQWLAVLAYLPEEELQQLAAALPEADLVVGGPTHQPVPPRNSGPVLMASATSKGKFLVHLEAPMSEGSWRGEIVEMGEKWGDESAQKQNLAEYLKRLGERDLRADQTGLVAAVPAGTPEGYRVAGTSACVRCHADAHQRWMMSTHARALLTLQERGFHVEPYCQQCHTTGYGMPEGFVSLGKSPAMGGVGCESCHGPSAGHVQEPKTRTAYFAKASDQCTRCHDQENSPKFNREAYWERIRHGQGNGSRGGFAQSGMAQSGEVRP